MCVDVNRRQFLAIGAAGLLASCSQSGLFTGSSVHTWGRPAIVDGGFSHPRAIGTTDDEVFVIDKSGRVQAFDHDGVHRRTWSLPKVDNGTPTGLTFASSGNVLIPDTHNSRILEYTREGELLSQWGTYGTDPGTFIYPTDLALASDGTYVVSEYGTDAERIQIFDRDAAFVRTWGKHGDAVGEFSRAMALVVHEDTIYVCDSANNRVQIFDLEGECLDSWGETGTASGQLKFPFDMALAPDGSLVLCDYGNNRIARYTLDGKLLGEFGRPGRVVGRFHGPRGVDVSPDGTVFVADTDNHRIQRFDLGVLS